MKAKAKKRSWFSRVTSIFFHPKQFFTKIVADGNMEDAILRAIIWGFVGGVLAMVLNIIKGADFNFVQLFKAIVGAPVLAIVLLFVFSGLMMLVSEITMGERDWEIAVKGTASVFFVYPLALILNTFAWDCVSLGIISIITDLYLLFLFYNISVYCMRGKRISVIFVIMVMTVFWAIVNMSSYGKIWFHVKNMDAAENCSFVLIKNPILSPLPEM